MKRFYLGLAPLQQLVFLIASGILSALVLLLTLPLFLSMWIPGLLTMGSIEMTAKHPIAFMLINFLPVQAGMMLVPGGLYLYLRGKSKLDSQKRKPKNHLIALLLFLSAFGALAFFSEINAYILKFLGVYEQQLASKDASDKMLSELIGKVGSSSYYVAILLISVLTGIAEELAFRRFLFHHFFKGTQKLIISLVASSFIFALLHFNFLQFIPLFVFGMSLAMMYYISGSIWPGVIAHMANNALNVYWLAGGSYPAWMDQIDLKTTIPSLFLMMGLFYFFTKNKF